MTLTVLARPPHTARAEYPPGTHLVPPPKARPPQGTQQAPSSSIMAGAVITACLTSLSPVLTTDMDI